MHYFASLSRNYGCTNILEIDDDTYNENIAAGGEYENEFCVRIDSYREDLIFQKKYINGEWVPAKPSDFERPTDERQVHMPDDMWLSDAIGKLSNLMTDKGTAKTSLVDAINQCFVAVEDMKRDFADLRAQLGISG